MSRRILNTSQVSPITDLLGLGTIQVAGYGNIQNQSASTWYDWSGWWSNAFQNRYWTLKKEGSILRVSYQVHVDHGDTWRSGVCRISMNDSASGTGNWVKLGLVGATNYISGYSTTGAMGYASLLVNPSNIISGATVGTNCYFKYEFRKQNGGGWSYINNFNVNQEGASDGQSGCSVGGLSIFVEELDSRLTANNWVG